MRGIYLFQTRLKETSFSGGSSSAPLHRKNTGTAQRSTLLQNRLLTHAREPSGQAKPPTAEVWISSVPQMAAVFAASTGTLRREPIPTDTKIPFFLSLRVPGPAVRAPGSVYTRRPGKATTVRRSVQPVQKAAVKGQPQLFLKCLGGRVPYPHMAVGQTPPAQLPG